MPSSVPRLAGCESNTIAKSLSSGIKKTRGEFPTLLLTNQVSLRRSLKLLHAIPSFQNRVILVPTTMKFLRAETDYMKCLKWWLGYGKHFILSFFQHTVMGTPKYQTLWSMLGRN